MNDDDKMQEIEQIYINIISRYPEKTPFEQLSMFAEEFVRDWNFFQYLKQK